MKLWTLLLVVLMLLATVSYFAWEFKPIEPFITQDWRAAAKYELACEGTTHVARTEKGFEITCKEK